MASPEQSHFKWTYDQILEANISKYDRLLETSKLKVESLKQWKERMLGDSPPNNDFEQALTETLSYCSAVFSIFRDNSHFLSHAEQLALAIIEMRNQLGGDVMPLHKFHTFNRGTFEIGCQTLCSAQYYEEIPFYGPPRKPSNEEDQITKIYEWKLISKPKAGISVGTPVKCVYYLEKGRLFGTCYYVLGMTAPESGIHASIKTFNEEMPSFSMVEQIIVKNLSESIT